ncbi:MAG: hypothetical protein AB7Q23_04970 [Hyphomonadaceae bacterium]
MFAKLLSRLTPLPASAHDRLFTTFAPDGAPAQVLHTVYHQYRDAFPDERVPPQHTHFRALVRHILSGDGWRDLEGADLRRVNSAYICCFERAEAYEFQLALWRIDPPFRKLLIETRERVVTELMPIAAAESARRLHFSRWKECLATPLDIRAPSLLALLRRMSPDDWHEIVLHWDWNAGVTELAWITAQRTCDRATALFALCAGAPGAVATGRSGRRGGDHAGFVRELAARLEGGFYPVAEIGLRLTMRQQAQFEWELAAARATGESPWQIPADLLDFEGRAHRPRYGVSHGQAHWHYEYWLEHIAPRAKR